MPQAGITLCQRHGLQCHTCLGTRNKGGLGHEPGFLEVLVQDATVNRVLGTWCTPVTTTIPKRLVENRLLWGGQVIRGAYASPGLREGESLPKSHSPS